MLRAGPAGVYYAMIRRHRALMESQTTVFERSNARFKMQVFTSMSCLPGYSTPQVMVVWSFRSAGASILTSTSNPNGKEYANTVSLIVCACKLELPCWKQGAMVQAFV